MAQKTLKLIIFLLTFTLLAACKGDGDHFGKVRKATLLLPNGMMLNVTNAITMEEQQKGLSGLKDEQFPNEEGMLFYYMDTSPKRFWMPDTYFNLDIVFLDDHLKIIAIERNVPAHPGMENTPPIAQTRSYYARHVLEVKANSKVSRMINVGDQLKFQDENFISQIESSIRQKK